MHATEYLWWLVNISSGNALVASVLSIYDSGSSMKKIWNQLLIGHFGKQIKFGAFELNLFS